MPPAFLGAVVVVGISGGHDGIIRLQIVAGQRDRHSNSPGRDIALGGGGIGNGVLGGISRHIYIGQCNRFAGPHVGIVIGALRSDCDNIVDGVNQIAGLYRHRNVGIGNSCSPVVDLPGNRHLRQNRLGLHGKGPDSAHGAIVGDRPLRLDRNRPNALDG